MKSFAGASETHTITFYRVAASYTRDGQVQDCSTAEVLGDAYGVTYATKEAAQSAADELQDSIEDYGLDPTTTYALREYPVQIYGIETSIDDYGATEVAATVLCADYQGSTYWSAKPRHTNASVDGLEPDNNSIDAWVDRDIGRLFDADAAVAMGLEILALAGRS